MKFIELYKKILKEEYDGAIELNTEFIDSLQKYYNISNIEDIYKPENINRKDNIKLGFTPLMFAVKYKQYNIIEKLLEKGADVNIANSDNNTALDISQDDEISDLLLDYGAVKNRK